METKNFRGERPHLYIKEFVVHLGLSDETVADKLGISRSAFWKWYTEQSRLNPDKVARIAAAMGIHPSQLNFPPGTDSLDAIVEGQPQNVRSMAADVLRRMISKSP